MEETIYIFSLALKNRVKGMKPSAPMQPAFVPSYNTAQ